MQDDFNGPVWADHHHRVAAMIHKLFAATMTAFVSLNHMQFDAPWRIKRQPEKCN